MDKEGLKMIEIIIEVSLKDGKIFELPELEDFKKILDIPIAKRITIKSPESKGVEFFSANSPLTYAVIIKLLKSNKSIIIVNYGIVKKKLNSVHVVLDTYPTNRVIEVFSTAELADEYIKRKEIPSLYMRMGYNVKEELE